MSSGVVEDDPVVEWPRAKHCGCRPADTAHRNGMLLFPLGRCRAGHEVHNDPGIPVICLGGTGSGKSAFALAPAVNGWRGPAAVVSIKPDLLRATWDHRPSQPMLFDPGALLADHYPGVGYDVVRRIRDRDEAKEVAAQIVAGARAGGLRDDDFWYDMALRSLQVLFYAAAANGYRLDDIYRWALTAEEFEVRSLLQATGDEAALWQFESICGLEQRTLSSVQAMVQQCLAVFDSPSALSSFVRDDLRMPDLVRGTPSTLYVALPQHRLRLYRPLVSVLMQDLVATVRDRDAVGDPVTPSVLLMLDEAGALAVPDLPDLVSTARSSGLQLVAAFQSASQVVRTYGEHAAAEVLEQSTLVLLGGRDKRTARLLDDAMDGEPLPGLPPRGLRALPRGKAVVVRDRDEQVLTLDPVWKQRSRPSAPAATTASSV